MRRLGISILFFLSSAPWGATWAQDTLWVRTDYDYIYQAVAAASPGNVIAFDRNHTETGMVTINKAVTIANPQGRSVTIIGGSSDPYALQITAAGAVVDGLSLQGGTSARTYVSLGTLQNCSITGTGLGVRLDSGTVSNCTISGSVGTGFEPVIGGGGLITGCTVSFESGSGVWAPYYSWEGTIRNTQMSFSSTSTASMGIYSLVPNGATIENCWISMAKGTGIKLEGGHATVSEDTVLVSAANVSNIGIKTMSPANDGGFTITHCLVTAWGGTGIEVNTSNNRVQNCTIDGANNGVVDFAGGQVTTSIASNCTTYGFNVPEDATYCIGWPNGFSPSSQGTGSVVQDPLYCNASAGEYTLRVDSYGNPGVNGTSQIGAFPVSCMFGTLARTSTYKSHGTLYMPGDVTVPSTMTLKLDPLTTVKVRGTDSLSAGSDASKVELRVSSGGTLNIHGVVDSAVVLTSNQATPAEGDWWGIKVNAGGTATIDYANVTYSDYGVTYSSTTAGHICHSTFSGNAINDITAAVGDGTMAARIDSNLVYVGGGSGILLSTDVKGLNIRENSILGDETETYAGINFQTFWPGYDNPYLCGNTIQGMSNGYGVVTRAASPKLETNEIMFAHYAIETLGGTALIGSADASSDNLIHNNFIGIRAKGGTPKVRNNQITENWYGVYADSIGRPNLGNVGDQGKNAFLLNSTCIRNYVTTDTLRAVGNWFGSCTPTPCWAGLVDVSSPLCSPPAGADVAMEARPEILTRPVVHGVLPNPMRGAGTIAFSLPVASDRTQVQIFDVSGRLVRDFGEHPAGSGTNRLDWNGLDDHGLSVMSGIYFIRLAVDGRQAGAAKALVVR